MNKLSNLLIPLLIITVFLAVTNNTLPRAHASPTVGLVCLADPSFATSTNACPTPPVVFTGPNSANNQLKIAVNVNQSDIFLGFDITLRAAHTILKPAATDLTNSILNSGPLTNVKCIGGVLISAAGSCNPTLDTADTIHFSVGQGVFVAGTGLLFTATFNVTGQATGGIPVGFQFGCGSSTVPTSIGPAPNVCITLLTNGPITPAVETFQEASFSNRPGFAISAVPASLFLNRNSTQSASIGLNSVLKFNGTVTMAVFKVLPSGLGASLSPASVKLNVTTGGLNSTILTVDATGTLARQYLVNVTGTSGSTILYVLVLVNVADFGITAGPASLTLSLLSKGTSTITLISINGYAGKINIATTQKPTTGLSVSCNPATGLQLNATQSKLIATSTCTFVPSTVGIYNINITGTDGVITHLVKLTVNVVPQDFVISPLPTTINVPVGGSNSTTIVLASIAKFSGAVDLTATPTGGLTASLLASRLSLSPDGVNETILTINAGPTVAPGTYVVTIGGVSGTLSHSPQVKVVVTSDFSISATPTSFTINVGSTAKSNITLTNLGSLAGQATLTAPTGGLTTTFNATTVNLTAATRKIVVLTITAPNGTSPGAYTILVTAQTGSITHTARITVNVILHDLRIIAVVVNASSATVGAKLTFNIIVQNTGTMAENATVNALVGNLTVATTNVILQPGDAKAVSLTWDTTGYTPGTYSLGGKVLAVPGEITPADNIDMKAATLNLTAPQTSPLSQNWLLLIVAIVVAAAIIIGALLLRRRTPTQTVQ